MSLLQLKNIHCIKIGTLHFTCLKLFLLQVILNSKNGHQKSSMTLLPNNFIYLHWCYLMNKCLNVKKYTSKVCGCNILESGAQKHKLVQNYMYLPICHFRITTGIFLPSKLMYHHSVFSLTCHFLSSCLHLL